MVYRLSDCQSVLFANDLYDVEDQFDVAVSDAALAEAAEVGTVSLDQVKRKYGL